MVFVVDLGSWYQTTERTTHWYWLLRAVVGHWINHCHQAYQPYGRGTTPLCCRLRSVGHFLNVKVLLDWSFGYRLFRRQTKWVSWLLTLYFGVLRCMAHQSFTEVWRYVGHFMFICVVLCYLCGIITNWLLGVFSFGLTTLVMRLITSSDLMDAHVCVFVTGQSDPCSEDYLLVTVKCLIYHSGDVHACSRATYS